MNDYSKLRLVLALVVLALVTRLLPHPPNFAPITSIALFSGVHFSNKRIAVFFPILLMLITDSVLGFHSLLAPVYLSFMIISLIGIYSKKVTISNVLLSSTVFFIITNFAVWLNHYPLTLGGLSACYLLAIPFFVNAIVGDLFYSFVLSYSFSRIEKEEVKLA